MELPSHLLKYSTSLSVSSISTSSRSLGRNTSSAKAERVSAAVQAGAGKGHRVDSRAKLHSRHSPIEVLDFSTLFRLFLLLPLD